MLRNREIYIIAIILILVSSNIHWGNDRWKGILGSNSDSKGYYAYLPALFIYHDLQFSFQDYINNKYHENPDNSNYKLVTKNGTANKYFCGTAITELPFFLLAHIITKVTGNDADGYSKYYMIFINLSAIFYSLFGLYFLKKILFKYNFNSNITTLVLIAIIFGTQLFYYTVSEPGMSHACSFGLISCLLFQIKYFFENENAKNILLISILLGVIILIRPLNIIIVFITPFLAGNLNNFKNKMKGLVNSKINIILPVITITLLISIQFILYKIETGNYLIYAYGNEKFIWTRPEILNILFSYKKGIFFYTPLIILSLAGLIKLFRHNRFECYSLIFFILIVLYLLSCWWCWWYGWSFSCRPLTDYLSVFGILLATLLTSFDNRKLKNSISGLVIALIFVCQVQIYQYRHFIIHPEKMDKDHYWRVYLRIDQLIKNENPNSDLLEAN